MEQMPLQDIMPTGWSKLLVFSDGPRQCLGFRLGGFEGTITRLRGANVVSTSLALFEFKVTLSTLIRKFEFWDTGAIITNKVVTSLQPICAGIDENPALPIGVKLLSEVVE